MPDEDMWPAALAAFVKEGVLGEGGMGAVHLVRSRVTDERYAAKISTLPRAAEQRRFLAELALWIDLPGHPNLAACRFFRTFDHRIAIFAEAVAGGSLEDVLRREWPLKLSRVLDIAIQSAHALHVLHQLELAHGDVKPGNLLLTADGQVKLADFGLSRGPTQPFAVAQGLTAQYASPEQTRGVVSVATDVWSWGLTVLAMFTRGAVWASGQAARIALDSQIRRSRELHGGGAPLPPGLVAVLQRCFDAEPTARWSNLFGVERALRELFAASTGSPYRRLLEPPIERMRSEQVRHADIDLRWPPPKQWLGWAWAQQEGNTTGQAAPGAGGATRVSQAINDLIAFEEVRAVLEPLADARPDLRPYLASVRLFRATILMSLEQHRAALDALTQVGAYYEQRQSEGDRNAQQQLASLLVNRAWCLRWLGAQAEALESLATALGIFTEGGDVDGRMLALTAIAGIHSEQGDGDAALDTILQALSIAPVKTAMSWERLVVFAGMLATLGSIAFRWGQLEYAIDALQSASQNLAQLLSMSWTQEDVDREAARQPDLTESVIRVALDRTRPQEALVVERWASVTAVLVNALNAAGQFDAGNAAAAKVIEELEKRAGKHRSAELLTALSGIYFSRSQMFALQAQPASRTRSPAAADLLRAGMANAQRAVELFEELVLVHGRERLTMELGGAYSNVASMLATAGEAERALQTLWRAIELLERFERSFPTREVTHTLCRVLVNCGLMLLHNRRPAEAPPWFDRALALYDDLGRAGGTDVAADRAWALYSRGYSYLLLDRVPDAYNDLYAAVPVLKHEASRTHRVDLVQQLQQIRMLFGDRDWEHDST